MVTKELFGKTVDGTEIYKYWIENKKGMKAAVINYGAILVNLLVPDSEGNVDDVVLGYGSLEDYFENGSFFGATVGPNANRIGGAEFTLNGVKYELEKNSGGKHNLHSGPNYYRDRIWETQVEEEELGTRISFSLFSPDKDQGYPGNADITVSYTLTEDNSLKLDYHMVCDADTVANLTNHAYFNLAGHDSGCAMNQKVWIDADAFTLTDADSIPTGKLESVKGTPLDFTEMKPIVRDIEEDYDQLKWAGGFDHNWALNHPAKELAFLLCIKLSP